MQEDKELQLIDLCARLPHGVKVRISGEIDGHLHENTTTLDIDNLHKYMLNGGYYKYGLFYKIPSFQLLPYLRPMSSITEEEFENLKEYSGLIYDQLDLASFQNGTYKCLDFYLNEVPSYVVIKVFDWLNKYHFDYRGLIEKGLAIAVTKENNPYE